MATAVLAAAMIIGSGLFTGAGGCYLLRRLPEPPDLSAAELAAKPSYDSLATRGFGLVSGGLSAAAAVIAVVTQPAAYWPIWFVFGTVAVLLATIDAVSTWLPSLIIHLGWPAMIAALSITALIGEPGASWLALVVRVLACSLAAGGFYLLLWIITRGRGIAFGDVRLMPLVGAAAGAISWPGLYWSLLLGSLIGAVMGVIRLLAGRREGLPYAPALVSGPYAAAVLLAVAG